MLAQTPLGSLNNTVTTAQTMQGVTEELRRLRAEQDEVMGLAIYVGMTKEQAQQYDERLKRIYSLYETLLSLKSGTQS